MTADDAFATIQAMLGGEPNRRGWYDVACPFCGKPAERGQVHFSYNATGYKCFVCDAHGTLRKLAEHLRIDAPVTPVTRQAPEPVATARWRQNPGKLLEVYRNPERYTAWKRYKPLSTTTIERFDFGYGRLPFQRSDGEWYMSRQPWLTVPLWEAGKLVGLRGRNLGSAGPKWISATGSTYTLWGVDYVRRNAVTWLCENYVDAAWLMQEHPEWCAVAIGGATTWQPQWAQMLKERQPKTVIVALDNDLPGQAIGTLRDKLSAEWTAERHTPPPEAQGPRIANALNAAGVKAMLFEWPEVAPVKAGIDWLLLSR